MSAHDTLVRSLSSIVTSKDVAGFIEWSLRPSRHDEGTKEDFVIEQILSLPSAEGHALWEWLETYVKHDEDEQQNLQMLSAIAECMFHLRNCFEVYEKFTSVHSSGYTQTLFALHDILLHLQQFPSASCLQNTISILCESFYLTQSSEQVVTQCLPFLLVKALTSTNTSSSSKVISLSPGPGTPSQAVKRLSAMKSALSLLDFEDDDSSAMMKELLTRAFVEPVFLKNNDGVKFLASIFSLHAPLIFDLHCTIKNTLALSPRPSVVKKYGSVYYKAWKESPFTHEIEENCIQDLMNCAIHASSSSLFKTLQTLLNVFHHQKRASGVDSMLHKLYQPILWRALTAANAVVRTQAAVLFVSVFPLREEEENNSLQDQFNALLALLKDSHPSVRVVAVTGVCSVMTNYWELFPTSFCETLLQILTTELVHDASSGAVRAAVYDGLTLLLENHMSHDLLRKILPNVGGKMIDDTNDSVRLSLIKLLVRVKSIRSISFYDIVSVDDLLRQFLTADKKTLNNLTLLFLRSFFPQDRSDNLVERVLAFIKRNSDAAVVFYANVHAHVSVGAVSKLAVLLFRTLRSSSSVVDQENVNEERSDTPPLLLKVIVTLLQSISKQYTSPRHSASRALLSSEFLPSYVRDVLESSEVSWQLLSQLKLIHEDELPPSLLESAIQAFVEADDHDGVNKSLVSCLVTCGEASTICHHTTEALLLEQDQGINPVVGLQAMLYMMVEDVSAKEELMSTNNKEILDKFLKAVYDRLIKMLDEVVRNEFTVLLHRSYFTIMILLAEKDNDDAVVVDHGNTVLTLLEIILGVNYGNKKKRRSMEDDSNDYYLTMFLATVGYLSEYAVFCSWRESNNNHDALLLRLYQRLRIKMTAEVPGGDNPLLSKLLCRIMWQRILLKTDGDNELLKNSLVDVASVFTTQEGGKVVNDCTENVVKICAAKLPAEEFGYYGVKALLGTLKAESLNVSDCLNEADTTNRRIPVGFNKLTKVLGPYIDKTVFVKAIEKELLKEEGTDNNNHSLLWLLAYFIKDIKNKELERDLVSSLSKLSHEQHDDCEAISKYIISA